MPRRLQRPQVRNTLGITLGRAWKCCLLLARRKYANSVLRYTVRETTSAPEGNFKRLSFEKPGANFRAALVPRPRGPASSPTLKHTHNDAQEFRNSWQLRGNIGSPIKSEFSHASRNGSSFSGGEGGESDGERERTDFSRGQRSEAETEIYIRREIGLTYDVDETVAEGVVELVTPREPAIPPRSPRVRPTSTRTTRRRVSPERSLSGRPSLRPSVVPYLGLTRLFLDNNFRQNWL